MVSVGSQFSDFKPSEMPAMAELNALVDHDTKGTALTVDPVFTVNGAS